MRKFSVAETIGSSEKLQAPVRSYLPTKSATAALYLVLALTVWSAHYWQASNFGLYEDDWYRIPKVMGVSTGGLWTLIYGSFQPEISQGRPLHPALIYTFSFFGYKLAGMLGIYVSACLILFTNAVLFHRLLINIFENRELAMIGALAFAIFPADTTQPFLTHALGLQPSISFLLISMLAYISGRYVLSYMVILLTLFTYETSFLVFAAVPLICGSVRKLLIRHLLILSGIFGSAVLSRRFTAEARLLHLGWHEWLMGFANMITGPVTCMSMYIYRPIESLFNLTAWNLIFVCTFVAVYACLFLLPMGRLESLNRTCRKSCTAIIAKNCGTWTPSPQMIIGAAIMLIAAYPLTMTTTGIAISGRGTRAHTSAIVGASILCACTCSWLLSRKRGILSKRLIRVGLAIYFALLVKFGLTVQQDYALGWQEQRGFWTDLVTLCPDLNDGDVIFVEPSGLRDTRQLAFLRHDLTGTPDTRQIKSLDVVYDVLPEIYHFPSSWKAPPRVYRLPRNWEQQVFGDDEKLHISTIEAGYSYFPSSVTTILSSKVIFLNTNGGRLSRRNALWDFKRRKMFPLKQDPNRISTIEKTLMYHQLIILPNAKHPTYLIE